LCFSLFFVEFSLFSPSVGTIACSILAIDTGRRGQKANFFKIWEEIMWPDLAFEARPEYTVCHVIQNLLIPGTTILSENADHMDKGS